MMDQTACFRRESVKTKQSCVSQCDKNSSEECQIITESLDTDTTSMLRGEGLSCSQSRSGSRQINKRSTAGIDTFFCQNN